MKTDLTYKGTRIIFGKCAEIKRQFINDAMAILQDDGFQEIFIPVLQLQETFIGKVGDENTHLMFTFKDRGDRDVCLAPEYTSVIQQLDFNGKKNTQLFYIGECFRGEKPQAGRWRQFTQLGVEIVNTSEDYTEYLIELATKLVSIITKNYEITRQVSRGLDYYKSGSGFEISCQELGAAKQVCGGGTYSNGIGFAIGVDRLLLLGSK